MPDPSFTLLWRLLCYFLPKLLPSGFGAAKCPDKHKEEELLTLFENVQGSLQRAEKQAEHYNEWRSTARCRHQHLSQTGGKSFTQHKPKQLLSKQAYLPFLHLWLFPSWQLYHSSLGLGATFCLSEHWMLPKILTCTKNVSGNLLRVSFGTYEHLLRGPLASVGRHGELFSL